MSYFDDDAEQGLSIASFRRIMFPSGRCRDEAGHVIVEHASPSIDGADLEVVRARPAKGTIEIPLFNTPKLRDRFGKHMVPDLHDELVNAIRANPKGDLFHPALGSFKAGITTRTRDLDPQKRNGWTLELSWIEHNGGARDSLNFDVWGEGDPTSAMSADAATADAASSGVGGWAPMSATTAAALTKVSEPRASVGQIDDALGALATLASGNLALVSLASQSSLVTTLEHYRSSVETLRRTLLGIQAPRRFTVPRTMALWDVAQVVYRSSLRASLLTQANAIPDPLAVPAGTVLLCPPDLTP